MAHTTADIDLLVARENDREDSGMFPEPDDEYEGQAPCPACFESSGHPARWVPHTWYEPGYSEPDYGRRCEYCDGTGMVPAELAEPPDQWEIDFDDPGYLAALEAAS